MTLDPAKDRAPDLAESPSSLPRAESGVPQPSPTRLRLATSGDRPFLVEMARLASVIEDRPLPEPTATEVVAMLPGLGDCAIIAVDPAGRAIGAAWWSFREPPLCTDRGGNPVPEMTLAVAEEWHGRGVGTSLIEELASLAAQHFGSIALNVHIRNPAARLYSRAGFQVAGKGRGPLGVAMLRTFDSSGQTR